MRSTRDGTATSRFRSDVRRGARSALAAGQRARSAGLEVGEGQARILLGDLRAHQGLLQQRSGREVSEAVAARRCRLDRFELSVLWAHGARGWPGVVRAIRCRPS